MPCAGAAAEVARTIPVPGPGALISFILISSSFLCLCRTAADRNELGLCLEGCNDFLKDSMRFLTRLTFFVLDQHCESEDFLQ